MRREDLDDVQLEIVKEILRMYVREMGMAEELGMTEDECVESQLDLLEAGLIEILKTPSEGDEGAFLFTVVPTEKAIAAYEGGR